MNVWLQMVLCLVAFVGIAFGAPSLLDRLAVYLDKRASSSFAPYEYFPCTPVAPRITVRDPNQSAARSPAQWNPILGSFTPNYFRDLTGLGRRSSAFQLCAVVTLEFLVYEKGRNEMKKLIVLLVLALCAFGCSAGSVEDVGEQQAAVCTGAPYAYGSAGCVPGSPCATPKSVTAIKQNFGFPGGTSRQLWAYYGGAWVLAVDFGNVSIDATISGSIGSTNNSPITKLTFTNQTFWDGPGTRITAECYNSVTFANDCATDEIVVHRLQVYANKTCRYGDVNHRTAGLTRVMGLGGVAYDDGTVSFRGYDKVTTVESYVSCDVVFYNACSPF